MGREKSLVVLSKLGAPSPSLAERAVVGTSVCGVPDARRSRSVRRRRGGGRCVHDSDFQRMLRVQMQVAARQRQADSGLIKKGVDALTQFAPHTAAVNGGS